MNARKVILDCDPGIDDALALMLALSDSAANSELVDPAQMLVLL